MSDSPSPRKGRGAHHERQSPQPSCSYWDDIHLSSPCFQRRRLDDYYLPHQTRLRLYFALAGINLVGLKIKASPDFSWIIIKGRHDVFDGNNWTPRRFCKQIPVPKELNIQFIISKYHIDDMLTVTVNMEKKDESRASDTFYCDGGIEKWKHSILALSQSNTNNFCPKIVRFCIKEPGKPEVYVTLENEQTTSCRKEDDGYSIYDQLDQIAMEKLFNLSADVQVQLLRGLNYDEERPPQRQRKLPYIKIVREDETKMVSSDEDDKMETTEKETERAGGLRKRRPGNADQSRHHKKVWFDHTVSKQEVTMDESAEAIKVWADLAVISKQIEEEERASPEPKNKTLCAALMFFFKFRKEKKQNMNAKKND